MQPFVIIVPCYNEAKRFKSENFVQFSREHTEVQFIFVDDGSKDGTGCILASIVEKIPSTKIVTLLKNSGKGEAVRQGLLQALKDNPIYIGYLDADLSTPLEEIYRIKKYAIEKKADIVLGSRIKKADTLIERSFARHIIGRSIATIIDQRFKLGIYDTQCGAKVFRAAILKYALKNTFKTSWFFDVEMILRLKTAAGNLSIYEIPLKTWKNVDNSRINVRSFPGILHDLFNLLGKYKPYASKEE